MNPAWMAVIGLLLGSCAPPQPVDELTPIGWGPKSYTHDGLLIEFTDQKLEGQESPYIPTAETCRRLDDLAAEQLLSLDEKELIEPHKTCELNRVGL